MTIAVPGYPTMYSQPVKPVTDAELAARDAQYRIDTARAEVQNSYVPHRQAIKEQSRIASAEVVQQQIRSDAQRMGMHRDVTLQKIKRLQDEVAKCKKHIKGSKRAIRWSWGLFPLSLVCGVATCGQCFPPTYFRGRKHHYTHKLERNEDEILSLTRVDNMVTSYTHSENMRTNDVDTRGQVPEPSTTTTILVPPGPAQPIVFTA